MLLTTSNFAPKFLPFNNFHVAELTGIEPDFLRGSARRLAKDREDIKHTTVLNYICRELGFRGGFAGFKETQVPKLEEFKKRHNLQIAGLHDPNTLDRPIQVDLVQISDRCFRSGRQCPTRVFTGAGVDWFDLLEVAVRIPGLEVRNRFTGATIRDTSEIPIARCDIANIWIIQLEDRILSLGDCWMLSTLLGDQLVQYGRNPDETETTFVAGVYFPNSMGAEKIELEEERYRGAAEILTRVIPKLKRGWVDVLPFNEKLIFLRDRAGGYDFVFPKLRKTKFNHNIHLPYLKNADVPKSDDLYHFRRWAYFESDGWLELDQHNAEQHYYAKGNQPQSHPGEEQVLRTYLIERGRYIAPAKGAPLTDGFNEVIIDGKRLAVSDPISIKEFRHFMMHENELYTRYRPSPPEQDDWRQCNRDDDIQSAPASVTWYDAAAFAANVSKARKLPVRLPTEKEWLAITKEFRSKLRAIRVDFEYLNAGRIVEKTEADEQQQFFGTKYRCTEAELPWEQTMNGVRFLRAIDFGEWLSLEGAAVNSLHAGAMNLAPIHLSVAPDTVSEEETGFPRWEDRVSAERDRMAPHSTGAYKRMRIGFRLVYELE